MEQWTDEVGRAGRRETGEIAYFLGAHFFH